MEKEPYEQLKKKCDMQHQVIVEMKNMLSRFEMDMIDTKKRIVDKFGDKPKAKEEES